MVQYIFIIFFSRAFSCGFGGLDFFRQVLGLEGDLFLQLLDFFEYLNFIRIRKI
jgi:hypothetical protein